MSQQAQDEFFVGYLQQRSPRQRRFLWASALLLVAASATLGFLLSASQPAADPGVFEFGVVRTLVATVVAVPGEEGATPLLTGVIADDGQPLPFPQHELLAVREGKFGAQRLLELAGQRVRLRGTLIHAPAAAMLEINSPAEPVLDSSPELTDTRSLGTVQLSGEIVDTKCFLGVMKPGRGSMHRACAVRCLSGGVPAGLRVLKPDGTSTVFVMVGTNGEPLASELLDLVAVPVTVSGEHLQRGSVHLLRTSREQIRRQAPDG